MENNENLVTEEEIEVTENTEQTVEETETEPEKKYTEDELNDRVNDVSGKRVARREARIRKEYDRKFGGLMDVLRAGMGVETVEEATSKLTDFYKKNGVEFEKKPEYSENDLEKLAKSDAAEIIAKGFEDVVEEVDRLTDIGFDNMTAREKAAFKVLAEHRHKTERINELARIGVTEEVYNSEEFQNFAAKYVPSTPIREIYDHYIKTQPKKEFKTMGSMKNNTADTGVKDYYSFEEASKFTKEDFDKNPALFKAVTESMAKWK